MNTELLNIQAIDPRATVISERQMDAWTVTHWSDDTWSAKSEIWALWDETERYGNLEEIVRATESHVRRAQRTGAYEQKYLENWTIGRDYWGWYGRNTYNQYYRWDEKQRFASADELKQAINTLIDNQFRQRETDAYFREAGVTHTYRADHERARRYRETYGPGLVKVRFYRGPDGRTTKTVEIEIQD